jgi:amino acid transporter
MTLLGFFILTGLTALALHPSIRVTPAATHATPADWFEAVLMMIYSYGGFEAALIATGETRDARKDIPFALSAAIGATTVVFIAVQYLVIHTIANVAVSSAPAVDSARQFLAPLGVRIVAAARWFPPTDISAQICCIRRESRLRWANTEISPHFSDGSIRAFERRIFPS